jgi:hypothetical protein
VPKYETSNLEILACLMHIFPGRRAAFYRRRLFAIRKPHKSWGADTRSWYLRYFQTRNLFGCAEGKVINRYNGDLWVRDDATMGWKLTEGGANLARATFERVLLEL